MEIEGTTIYLKSETINYQKEKAGNVKDNTIREFSGDELKNFKNSELSRIIITEINEDGDLGDSFERTITDITPWLAEYRTRPNKTMYWAEHYIISWRPERKRGRPKMRGEDAVSEKGM